MAIISLKNAEIVQSNRVILKNVNFDINAGDFVFFVGKTGSGKSSLLQTLYGDLWLERGTGTIADFQLEKVVRKDLPFLRRKLGIVFQDFQLLTDRNVGENLIFFLKAVDWIDNIKIKARIDEVLEKVKLHDSLSKMPYQLSGGEQQRVAIARALLNNPEILIADEPTGNLDPEVGDEILKTFHEINKEGKVLLMATHNYDHILKYGGRIFKCENQEVTEVVMQQN